MFITGLKFAPTLNSYTGNSLVEALEFSQQTTFSTVSCILHDLSMSCNEENTVTVFGVTYQFTDFAYRNFCKILGIPNPFAYQIPHDLLFHNISSLLALYSSLQVTLIVRHTNNLPVIANVVKGDFKDIFISDFLAFFDGKDNISYIELGENLCSIGLLWDHAVSFFIEDKGTALTFKLGSVVYNYPTGHRKLHVTTCLYDLKTGAYFILPVLGKMNATYSLAPEERMLRFVETLEVYDSDIVALFETRLSYLHNSINYFDFCKLWSNLKLLAGDQVANTLMNVDEGTKASIFKEVASINQKDAKIKGEFEKTQNSLVLPHTVYDIITNISSYGLTAFGDLRKSFETLAGKFLTKSILQI